MNKEEMVVARRLVAGMNEIFAQLPRGAGITGIHLDEAVGKLNVTYEMTLSSVETPRATNRWWWPW